MAKNEIGSMRQQKYLALSLFQACSLVLCSMSQGVCDERRVLRGAVWHDPPGQIIDQGQYSGIDIDILRLIAKHHNWEIEFFECSIKRCEAEMALGKLDITSHGFNPELEDNLHFVEPPLYISSANVFYFRKGTGTKLETHEDLQNLSIGTRVGQKYYKPFSSDTTLNKIKVPYIIQLFKMLEAGRIDTFIGFETSTDENLKRSGFKNKFEKAPYRIHLERKGGIHISKKSSFAKDRVKIGEFIQQLLDSGKLKEIEDNYNYSSSLTQPAPK